jgi:SAM-dependent methyltransferase
MRQIIDGYAHHRLVVNKPYLKIAYSAVYRQMLDAERRFVAVDGARVEIGSSGGFIKDLDAAIVSTDVRYAPGVDVVADARALPWREQSIRAVFAKDCLHHIPDLESFFDEVVRCVRPGGAVICVDPYWGPFAQVAYRLFHPEEFRPRARTWSFSPGNSMDANQALLYILLRRDRSQFERQWPELEILEIGPLIGPSYALSGGAEKPALLPSGVLTRMHDMEVRTNWWRRPLALGFLCVFRVRTC